MEPFLLKKQTKNIKKMSKNPKISLMLFFKRGFVRLGSVLHIFLDHRKSKKISKKTQKPQKKTRKHLSNLLEKNKKNKKKQEKTK
jgi:hypothetical protein